MLCSEIPAPVCKGELQLLAIYYPAMYKYWRTFPRQSEASLVLMVEIHEWFSLKS